MDIWCITVSRKASPFGDRSIYVIDSPFRAAEWVSNGNPGERVTLSAYARNRAVYVDGRIVDEFRDLRKFFSNISDAQQWAWENGNELPGSQRDRTLAVYAAECPSCLAKVATAR
jgi:hypothetical protein